MNIGHINTNVDWGGGEYQVFNLVEGLVSRGVKTTLFAHPDGELFKRSRISQLPVVALPHESFGAFRQYFPSKSMVAMARKYGCDMLHLHDSGATSLGAGLRRKLGLRVLVSRRIASPLRGNLISRDKYSEKNVDAVIAISETVKQVFAESGYPGERIHVVQSGLDIDKLDAIGSDDAFKDKYGKDGMIVGGLGRLSVKKNFELMVRCAAQMRGDGEKINWVLLGDGPELGRLQDLAAKLGVSDNFHFLGFIENGANMLKNFDALFFPSLMEGASVTVREAMVLKVPVIAVDAPGTMESLAGCCWDVKGDDAEGAARSVREALSDKEKRADVCARARASALARFDINDTVEGTVDVYKKYFS